MAIDLLARATENGRVHIEHTRENVFTVVATGQELSALIAAGRMALDVMRAGSDRPPREATEHLERVLDLSLIHI